MRTAQNSSPGFCAAGVEFGKVSIKAQFDPAPVELFIGVDWFGLSKNWCTMADRT
jgi:hypothetical protein